MRIALVTSAMRFTVRSATEALEPARWRLVLRLSGGVERAAERLVEPQAKDVENHRQVGCNHCRECLTSAPSSTVLGAVDGVLLEEEKLGPGSCR